ncbi:unnamed protein product, partial [Phaeothamnion confervicola]
MTLSAISIGSGGGTRSAVLRAFQDAMSNKAVAGVPFFLISRDGYPGSYRLCGAQPERTFSRAFSSLLIDRTQLVTMLKDKAAQQAAAWAAAAANPRAGHDRGGGEPPARNGVR